MFAFRRPATVRDGFASEVDAIQRAYSLINTISASRTVSRLFPVASARCVSRLAAQIPVRLIIPPTVVLEINPINPALIHKHAFMTHGKTTSRNRDVYHAPWFRKMARTAIVIIVRDENFNKLKAKGYTATYIIHDRCESAVYIRTRAWFLLKNEQDILDQIATFL